VAHFHSAFTLESFVIFRRRLCRQIQAILYFQFVALIGVAVFVPTTVCAIDQDDPAWVGVWQFNEGEGTTVADVVNGNDGEFNGTFDWGPGVIGNGTAVEVMGDGSIDVPDSPSLGSISEGLTVAAWFRVDADSDTGIRKNGAFLLEDQSASEPIPNGFSFRIWTDQGLSPGLYGTTELVQGEWYHVAGTYDGDVMEMYINGIPESIFGTLDASGAEWVPEWAGELNPGDPLQLKFGPEAFTGAMDEVMILNRALSIEEIFEILPGWDSLVPTPPCDFVGNTVCDIDDINALMQEIVAGTSDPLFDMTGDGAVNLDDRDAWLASAGVQDEQPGPYLPGDANLSGMVGSEDLNALALGWQGDSNNWSDGNFDAGAGATAGDLNLLALNWQQSSGAAAANAVPEPSTGWALAFMLGLSGFLVRRR
jgi:hypothetical protein